MHSSVPLNKKPFVVARRENDSESALARLLNRALDLSPWLSAALFAAFLLVCNAGLDWYMLTHHQSSFTTIEVSDGLSAAVAGILFWRVAVYRRERRRLLRQRLEIIGDMNHHIRNALEVISLSAHTSSDEQYVTQIRESVDRITWALKEILPKI